MDDCKQLWRTDQSQSTLSSCLVTIIKPCQSSWYSLPTLQKKKVRVLLHCKICRIRTARFLAAFQWFISFIFGTKLFIFKGCRCNTQSSASKKQGHLWISLNGAPCPSSFIGPLLHNHRHPKCFSMFGRLASFQVIKELKICHALLIKDLWPQLKSWSDEG